jgi:hypothetical protein
VPLNNQSIEYSFSFLDIGCFLKDLIRFCTRSRGRESLRVVRRGAQSSAIVFPGGVTSVALFSPKTDSFIQWRLDDNVMNSRQWISK